MKWFSQLLKIPSCLEFASTYSLFPCDTADTTGSEARSVSLAGLSLVSTFKTKLFHEDCTSLAVTLT